MMVMMQVVVTWGVLKMVVVICSSRWSWRAILEFGGIVQLQLACRLLLVAHLR